MPGPRVPFVDENGLISAPWYRWFAAKERDASAAVAGEVTAGDGLSGGGVVSDGVTIEIETGGVENSMLRDSLALSVIGRFQATAGPPADIVASADNRILARIGGVLAFHSLAVVPAVVADGDYGDITISGVGTVYTIDAATVTLAKMANLGTDRIIGRDTAGSGVPESLTVGGGIEFSGAGGIQTSAFTGDATKAAAGTALTLATVNANVGTFGSATQSAQVTFNAKGLATAAANVTITPAASSVTGGAALTRVDDTNVTLTLGGSPTTALLAAASVTVVWAGVLSVARGGTGVSTSTGTVNVVLSASPTLTGTVITQNITGTGLLSFTQGTAGVAALLIEGVSGAGIIVDFIGGGDNYYDASTHIWRNIAGTEQANLTLAGLVLTGTVTGTNITAGGNTIGNSATATKWATGRTITTTGDATGVSAAFDGSANLSFALTIPAGTVTLAKMADVATARIFGRVTAATGVPEALTAAQAKTVLAITAADIGSGAALTKVDDTNVTATLGGTPTAALLAAASLTLGWTGTLSVARGGTGVGTITGLMQGNGTSAVTGIGNSSTVGQVLRVTGAATYAWGALDLADTDAVTGILPVANGGVDQTAWDSWVPSWTNLTLGNGTATALYMQLGKTVFARLCLVFGSTTSISGDVIFSLPITQAAYAGTAGITTLGWATLLDAGVAAYEGAVRNITTTTANIRAMTASGTYVGAGATLSSTIPFTWATGDEMIVQIFYEAA